MKKQGRLFQNEDEYRRGICSFAAVALTLLLFARMSLLLTDRPSFDAARSLLFLTEAPSTGARSVSDRELTALLWDLTAHSGL